MSLGTIFAAIGNATSAIMFLCSIHQFIRIWRNRSTLGYSSAPYVASLLNCVLWDLYGAPINKDVTVIITINSFGLILNTFYLASFLINAKGKALKIALIYLAGAVVCMLALGLGVNLGFHNKNTRITIYGIICVVFNIAMYWAPLSVVVEVFKTKSAEFMPFLLCVMVFVNSILWMLYGILKKDVYVLIPNVLGVGGGVLQLFLHYWFYKPGNLFLWEAPQRKTAETTKQAVAADVDVEKGGVNVEKGIELPNKEGTLHNVRLN